MFQTLYLRNTLPYVLYKYKGGNSSLNPKPLNPKPFPDPDTKPVEVAEPVLRLPLAASCVSSVMTSESQDPPMAL